MGNRIHVLVVDDEDSFRTILSNELEEMGFFVLASKSGEDAVKKVVSQAIDVVLLDIRMPGMDGIEALRLIKERSPGSEVIMMTAWGSINSTVEAVKLGAYHYLIKPCKLDEIEATINKAYKKKRLSGQTNTSKQELDYWNKFPNFVGKSDGLRAVLQAIDRVASTNQTVLIYGETGTGKELVARSIHDNSLRAKKLFYDLDCTTLHENLLESELFGYEKGAYTGAENLKHGMFKSADGGTFFMDEIGEINLAIQAKLLGVLEKNTFRRLGGNEIISVDVRVITATNRDLKQLTNEGKFRQDLFYRLGAFSIHLPPLRERKEDIPLLAQHFAENPSAGVGAPKAISQDVMQILSNFCWPGNVRQLKNVVETAIILSEGDMIFPEHLPPDIQIDHDFHAEPDGELPTLDEVINRYIARIMELVKGHRGKAAKILGISERNLYRKLGSAIHVKLSED